MNSSIASINVTWGRRNQPSCCDEHRNYATAVIQTTTANGTPGKQLIMTDEEMPLLQADGSLSLYAMIDNLSFCIQGDILTFDEIHFGEDGGDDVLLWKVELDLAANRGREMMCVLANVADWCKRDQYEPLVLEADSLITLAEGSRVSK